MLKLLLWKYVTTVKIAKNVKDFTPSKLKSKKNGFLAFNKHVKYWDIRDPEFNETNREFEVRSIRDSTSRM